MNTNTAKEIPKLTLSFKDFKLKIEDYATEAVKLYQLDVKTEEQLIELNKKTEEWEKRVLEFLANAFTNSRSYWVHEFSNIHIQSYNIPGIEKTWYQKIDIKKKTIAEKQNYLIFNLRILSVCDAIIKPDDINLEERKNYGITEKTNLILNKLYELYDDFSYPIEDILIYNGIIIKRSNEAHELVKALKMRGYAESQNGIGVECHARLTAEGAIFVEENRRPANVDYSKINKTSEELNTKIDDIIEQLKKHGYGQEILFDELQELKELYTMLNHKTWGQVVKGKLMDLALGKLVENDTLKYIYKELTDQALQLL